jgi:hypothetical protein
MMRAWQVDKTLRCLSEITSFDTLDLPLLGKYAAFVVLAFCAAPQFLPWSAAGADLLTNNAQ